MLTANIIEVFLRAATAHPERPVLLQDNDSISYRELREQVQHKAAELSRKGIGRGDAVLVFVPLSVDLYRTVLALFYLGAVPVFLDEWVSMERLKACVRLVPCKALIAPLKLRLVAWFVPVLRRITVKCGPGRASASALEDPAPVDAGNTALITFTTGSTGTPKAADRTHRFLQAQLEALQPLLEDGLQRTLTMLPIVVLLNMALGKATVLPPRRFKAKKPATYPLLAAAIRHYQPQSLILSPAIAVRLLDSTPAETFSRTRRVLTGGGPVLPDLAQQFAAKMPSAAVLAVFGSTEAEPIAHIDGAELAATLPETLLKDGLPLGTVDVHARVLVLPWHAGPIEVPDDERLVSMALHGRPGEIVVSGKHVLEHYIGNPEAEARNKIRTAERVWHRTGDCGRLDAAGRLFLYGRCEEVFELTGRTVYPMLIEFYLQQTAGLSGVAVLPLAHGMLLVLEKKDRDKQKKVLALTAALGLTGLRTALVKAIPRDPRHQTKVDREQLKVLLRRK